MVKMSDMAANAFIYTVEKSMNMFLKVGLGFSGHLAIALGKRAWWLAKVLSPGKIKELLLMMEKITEQLKQVSNLPIPSGGSVRRSMKKHKKKSNKKYSRKNRKSIKKRA